MKKLASIFLCLNLLIINQSVLCAELFSDTLAEKLDKNLKIEKPKQTIIKDEFVLNTLSPDLKINNVKQNTIVDEFALKSLNPNLQIKKANYVPLSDNLANRLDKNLVVKNNKENKKIYSASTDVIKISPVKNYTTRNSALGDSVNFVLMSDTKINNTLYKKGYPISAKVENISQNGAYGVPSDVVIGNFKIENQILDGNITKQGANRSIWVYPTAYMLLPFFGMGLFVLPIRGGHAKLYSSKVYEIDI